MYVFTLQVTSCEILLPYNKHTYKDRITFQPKNMLGEKNKIKIITLL